MLKKILLSTLCALCIAGCVLAATTLSASTTPVDFSNITTETYPQYWAIGESFKSNGNQEHPDLFGRQWRKASTNSISLVTPRMIIGYLAFSHTQRLLALPLDLEDFMIKNNDTIYVATWTNFFRTGMFSEGAAEPQLPTQRLVIEKDGVVYRPTEMPKELYDLMPHSFGLTYYGFPRNVILNAPYQIKWVNGYGNILNMDVPKELVDSLIDDELHFYNKK